MLSHAAQQKYTAFDRDLFACYLGIRHFQYMLESGCCAIFTDRKPLTYSLLWVSTHGRQATKSSSLIVWTVQVEGASLMCDVACGITRPLVPLVDSAAVFHTIPSVANLGICAIVHMFCLEHCGQGCGSHVP
jgi:hypothetical protein